MPSTKLFGLFSAIVRAPLQALPASKMRLAFPLPPQLLRPLGSKEVATPGLWSAWLASWGWTWAVARESCEPVDSHIRFHLAQCVLPQDFDARVLALATVLHLNISGKPLAPSVSGCDTKGDVPELDSTWRGLRALPEIDLANALAAALFRTDGDTAQQVFALQAAAPFWLADLRTVLVERRPLRTPRAPQPAWLRDGYRLLEQFDVLRGDDVSLQDWEAFWRDFPEADTLPAIFPLSYWWEATYCLSERNEFEAANAAAARVDQHAKQIASVTGLVEPLWHYQRARLHYYEGRHGEALGEFAREIHLKLGDSIPLAMLCREMANVLSDTGCLDASDSLVNRSIEAATSLGQDDELYKSLGRRGEIALKRGQLQSAEADFVASLAIQQRANDSTRSPGQTLTYLGHVMLLAKKFTEAEAFYKRAESENNAGASLPYITMGRFALAHRRGDKHTVQGLWLRHEKEILEWRTTTTLVLPATVCCVAASGYVSQAKALLADFANIMVTNNYIVEAFYLMPLLSQASGRPIVESALVILANWQKFLSRIDPGAMNISAPFNAPAVIAGPARNCRKSWDWKAYPHFSLCYPLTLVATEPPLPS